MARLIDEQPDTSGVTFKVFTSRLRNFLSFLVCFSNAIQRPLCFNNMGLIYSRNTQVSFPVTFPAGLGEAVGVLASFRSR